MIIDAIELCVGAYEKATNESMKSFSFFVKVQRETPLRRVRRMYGIITGEKPSQKSKFMMLAFFSPIRTTSATTCLSARKKSKPPAG